MRSFNHTTDGLRNIRRNLPILVFLLLAHGIFFLPTECGAQAVPPRSQTLQMIKPITRPPELPLEKEIRKTRQELEAATIELDRKMEIQKTIVYVDQQLRDAEAKLACFKKSKADCKKPNFLDNDSKVCGERYTDDPLLDPCAWAKGRIDWYQHRVNDLSAKLGVGRGGKN